MKWVLILMVDTSGGFSIAVSPHQFQTENQCKAFVHVLRQEHRSKRIDASCILMADDKAAKRQGGGKDGQ